MRKDKSNIIYKKIKRDILKGELKSGDVIPSERELMQIFNMSRTPIRKALDELERENLIIRRIGDGTYVNIPILDQVINKFYSFTEEMKKRGKTPTGKVVNFEEKEDDIYGIYSERTQVYEIERIKYADEEPLMYSQTIIPKRIVADLTKEILKKKPLYEILREKCDFRFLKAEQKIKPCLVNKIEAEYLNVPEGSLGILIERKLFMGKDIVEYSKGIVRGDRFEFTIKYNMEEEDQ
ncbi:GntR family transcriptional regulator [Fusobacterium sp.]|uniref:GntR family transcriptional regulator n=1 Tax=Fusobacterium sp. TaxID=68766 RepID=UPI0029036250|nr:GntR family transcriptional regulator [Fusobacterium sp.]MDU1912368.1 GntR family transcriptional regulator [Fusobacterium sp.]